MVNFPCPSQPSPSSKACTAPGLRSSRLQEHLQKQRDLGEPHVAKPRHAADRRSSVCVLDLPLPQTLRWQPQRCDTCRLLRSGLAAFAVTDADIMDAAPTVLRHDPKSRGVKEKPVFFTRPWLLHVLQNFNESLSARQVRRTLMQVYSANLLASQFKGPCVSVFHALPSSHALRSVILTSLNQYLDTRARQVQALVCVYSGQLIRGDGHWKLARRVFCPKQNTADHGRRPFTALSHVCKSVCLI